MFMDYCSARARVLGGSCSQESLTDKISDRSDRSDCGCQMNENQGHGWGLKNYPLAMVYSPLQEFENLFDTELALEKGTLFSELDLPFMGESVYKSGRGGCGCG